MCFARSVRGQSLAGSSNSLAHPLTASSTPVQNPVKMSAFPSTLRIALVICRFGWSLLGWLSRLPRASVLSHTQSVLWACHGLAGRQVQGWYKVAGGPLIGIFRDPSTLDCGFQDGRPAPLICAASRASEGFAFVMGFAIKQECSKKRTQRM